MFAVSWQRLTSLFCRNRLWYGSNIRGELEAYVLEIRLVGRVHRNSLTNTVDRDTFYSSDIIVFQNTLVYQIPNEI